MTVKKSKAGEVNQQRNLTGILIFTIIAAGGYYEWVSAVSCIGLICHLFYVKRQSGGLMYPRGFPFAALCLIPVFAAITVLYAVDRGEALLGVIKFAPLPIFALAAVQMEGEQKEKMLEILPSAASVMTVIAGAGSLTPAKELFFQAGRLGGFFQYPNTYAVFLLTGIIVLCSKERWRKKEQIQFIICLAGIVWTGSRSIFVLVAGYLLYVIIRKHTLRRAVGFICGIGAGGLFLVFCLTGKAGSFGRTLTMAGDMSSFWGRLLYDRDALFMLREFPLGMGYRGYYFVQGTFQTGDYAVMYVHNELLQCALDFGILCAVLAGLGMVCSIFSRKVSSLQRTILALVLLHSLFDFDLQFAAMDLILILCMDLGEVHPVNKASFPVSILLGVLLVLQLYGVSFLGLEAAGMQHIAFKLYPGLTLSQAEAMQQSYDPAERTRLADCILARNDYCAAAYKVKAELAAEEKDFVTMEQCARKAIKRDRYNETVYEDYIADLSLAMDYYVRIGNQGKALEFLQYTASVDELMQQAEKQASPLAFKTRDDPAIELPDEYNRYLQQMKTLWKENSRCY